MKILLLLMFLIIFSCGEEPQENDRCVYNTKLQRCIDEPCREGYVKEKCYQWYDRTDNCICFEGCFQRVYTGEIYDYYCENLEGKNGN